MLKKLLISIAIGTVLIYLSLRGINLHELSLHHSDFNALYLIPTFALLISLPMIRSLRLKILFVHLKKVEYYKMLLMNNIGYFFIMLLPLRLGELAIPYMMKRDSGISMASAMSVIFVERMIDFIVLLGFLFFISFILFLPPWLMKSGIIISVLLAVVVIALFVSYRHSHLVKSMIDPVLKRMPMHLQERIRGILGRFKEGFRIINSPGLIIVVVLISIVVWSISVMIIYCLLRFQGVNLGFMAAITVMVVNVIGVSLPSGPGVIGNFQYSCIVALSFFGVERNASFIFANLYYIIGMSFTMLIGIISFAVSGISFREIRENLQLK